VEKSGTRDHFISLIILGVVPHYVRSCDNTLLIGVFKIQLILFPEDEGVAHKTN